MWAAIKGTWCHQVLLGPVILTWPKHQFNVESTEEGLSFVFASIHTQVIQGYSQSLGHTDDTLYFVKTMADFHILTEILSGTPAFVAFSVQRSRSTPAKIVP